MSSELTLIIAIVGLCVSMITIISFVTGRRDKGRQDGMEQGELSNSIEYIKQTQTNILIGQKETNTKLDRINEEVIVLKVKEETLEEKEKDLEKRVEKLERKKRGE